jgi:hypothetical protein
MENRLSFHLNGVDIQIIEDGSKKIQYDIHKDLIPRPKQILLVL